MTVVPDMARGGTGEEFAANPEEPAAGAGIGFGDPLALAGAEFETEVDALGEHPHGDAPGGLDPAGEILAIELRDLDDDAGAEATAGLDPCHAEPGLDESPYRGLVGRWLAGVAVHGGQVDGTGLQPLFRGDGGVPRAMP